MVLAFGIYFVDLRDLRLSIEFEKISVKIVITGLSFTFKFTLILCPALIGYFSLFFSVSAPAYLLPKGSHAAMAPP